SDDAQSSRREPRGNHRELLVYHAGVWLSPYSDCRRPETAGNDFCAGPVVARRERRCAGTDGRLAAFLSSATNPHPEIHLSGRENVRRSSVLSRRNFCWLSHRGKKIPNFDYGCRILQRRHDFPLAIRRSRHCLRYVPSARTLGSGRSRSAPGEPARTAGAGSCTSYPHARSGLKNYPEEKDTLVAFPWVHRCSSAWTAGFLWAAAVAQDARRNCFQAGTRDLRFQNFLAGTNARWDRWIG